MQIVLESWLELAFWRFHSFKDKNKGGDIKLKEHYLEIASKKTHLCCLNWNSHTELNFFITSGTIFKIEFTKENKRPIVFVGNHREH